MAKAETPSAAKGKDDKKGNGKDEKKSSNRTSFKDLWPSDAKLTCLVKENPKKSGSKSAERFEHYFTSKTVGDFLKSGGTYQDIAYDIPRGRIQVG